MQIKKFKLLLLFLNIFLLAYCKKNPIEKIEQISIAQKQDNLDFDKILKCSDYSYSDNYFVTADYGCIYNPKGKNTFGNLIIYLFPKDKLQINNNEIKTQVNALNIEKLKENFEIYIFLIPKEFLNYNAEGDPTYYQKERYTEKLFTYDANKWKLIDSINVNGSSDNQKEQEWRDVFLKKHLNSNEQKNEESAFSLPQEYYEFDSAVIDLKSKTYKIVALENKKEKNNEGNWHFNLPIIILNKKGNEFYKIYQNNNLVYKFNDNCPADGYDGIVVKNNFFTVQQISCIDFEFVNSYITFKIDESTDKIYLHKYGEEYTDRSDPNKKIPLKTWSTKDFGIKKFEDVSEDFLKSLRDKKPRP